MNEALELTRSSLRTALEDARHTLTALNGMVAADGVAPEETFVIDESAVIAKLDDALAEIGRLEREWLRIAQLATHNLEYHRIEITGEPEEALEEIANISLEVLGQEKLPATERDKYDEMVDDYKAMVAAHDAFNLRHQRLLELVEAVWDVHLGRLQDMDAAKAWDRLAEFVKEERAARE